MKYKLILVFIVGLALVLRFYGLNWDQGQHLHPDERFLTMVAEAMTWPKSISDYLNPTISTLNPHNIGFSFYVYGTFPVIIVKYLAFSLNMDNYADLVLVGRGVSALLDVLIVLLVFLIGKNLFKNSSVGIGSALVYSIYVLPIQLAHFFAVDTFLTFFLVLSFYLLILMIQDSKVRLPREVILAALLGISLGLAFSSKVSAAFLTPVIGLGLIYKLVKGKKLFNVFLISILIAVSAIITTRFFYPYLFATDQIINFTLNPKTLNNLNDLNAQISPDTNLPPAIQWINTPSILYPLYNMVLWGMGIPLGIIALIGIVYLFRLLARLPLVLLLLVYSIGLFIYQGMQFAMPVRYFYPIYPFLALASGKVIFDFLTKIGKHQKLLLLVLLLTVSVWPTSFLSIYSRPHSRVTASEWIYNNIPVGSYISCEHWDDCLPLNLAGFPGNGAYEGIEFPLYNPDSPTKWAEMSSKLSQVDYIILSSNRLYGSIMTVPEKFPKTNEFYYSLFAGKLGFEKIAEFTSRPNIPIPFLNVCITPPGSTYGSVALVGQECPLLGISFVDDYADEVFTVYDHPKVIIFKKVLQNVR